MIRPRVAPYGRVSLRLSDQTPPVGTKGFSMSISPNVERAALSVRETAQRLGVSPHTVWRLIAEGEIRSIRARHRVLIPVSSLEKLLAGDAK